MKKVKREGRNSEGKEEGGEGGKKEIIKEWLILKYPQQIN